MRCSRLFVISGQSRNMSLLKTRLPGLLPEVECMPACMACMAVCMAIDSALSMKSFTLVKILGGSLCRSVHSTFPTV